MDENEQPIKKRGRPKGSKNKAAAERKPIEGRLHGRPPKEDALITVEQATLTPKKDGNPDTTVVPNMILSCTQIRQNVDIENPATLFNAMEQYLSLCAMSGMKISNGMLYYACHVTRTVVHDWMHGRSRKGNPDYKRFAETVKEICSAAREQYGLEGQVNPILTIFHQKYYDGFKDNPPDNAVENPLGDIEDPQKLAEKYADIIVD